MLNPSLRHVLEKAPFRKIGAQAANNLLSTVSFTTVSKYPDDVTVAPGEIGYYEGTRYIEKVNGDDGYESVDHPPHYGGDTPYEAIKVIEAWGLGFCLGNAVKYISRAGNKPGVSITDDLRKAVWYIQREISDIEKRKS